MKSISLLGSTGSIGRQTVEIAESLGIRVCALTANKNVKLIEEQARRLRPRLAVMTDKSAAAQLKLALADTGIRVASGREGLIEAATLPDAETVVTAVMGMVGLEPTLAAIDERKRIALANKETLVCGGELVMARAQERGAEIVPVDSEHSAIFQCLHGNENRSELKRLILTASGGPFFGRSRAELETVTPQQALKHPNWSMGAKITIDSATMMNKGLELIEAMRLYGVSADRVSVAVHRQSVVHSMIEFVDGSVLAQLGAPDMRLPIQYALTYPQRLPSIAPKLDLFSCGALTFEAPDDEAFPSIPLARRAAEAGQGACAVLNGANEAAVALFLEGKIGFCDIYRLTEGALSAVKTGNVETLEDILAADAAARQWVMSCNLAS